MSEAVHNENQRKAPSEASQEASAPTSPENMHHEAATAITSSLKEAGHRTAVDNVKGHPVFKPTRELEEFGVKPVEVDISTLDPRNILRLSKEEIDSVEGGIHRSLGGKGRVGAGMNLTRWAEQARDKLLRKKAA